MLMNIISIIVYVVYHTKCVHLSHKMCAPITQNVCTYHTNVCAYHTKCVHLSHKMCVKLTSYTKTYLMCAQAHQPPYYCIQNYVEHTN